MKWPIWLQSLTFVLREDYRCRKVCAQYAEDFCGGEVPKPWREREGLPPSGQWPKSDGIHALVKGAVRSGRVRPIVAASFPAIGGTLPEADCEEKPDLDPAKFPTLGQSLAAVDEAAGRPVVTGPKQ